MGKFTKRISIINYVLFLCSYYPNPQSVPQPMPQYTAGYHPQYSQPPQPIQPIQLQQQPSSWSQVVTGTLPKPPTPVSSVMSKVSVSTNPETLKKRFGTNQNTTIETNSQPHIFTPQPKPSSNNEIPLSLKSFIRRSLATCDDSNDKKLMTKALEKIVAKVKIEQRLHIHKWDLEPIPIVKIQPIIYETSNNNIESIDVSGNKRKSRFEKINDFESDLNGNISLQEYNNKKYKPSTLNSTIETIENPQENKLRQERANRFQPINNITQQNEYLPQINATRDSNNKISKKKTIKNSIKQSNNLMDSNNDFNIETLQIIGTSQILEKDYFRLTTAPDPTTVRPLEILKKSLIQLKNKWKSGNLEYIHICSQLKAIRQDLTVQNIRNRKYLI